MERNEGRVCLLCDSVTAPACLLGVRKQGICTQPCLSSAYDARAASAAGKSR